MKKTLVLVAVAASLCACAIAPSASGSAIYARTLEPVLVSGNAGMKTGKACAKNYLGIVSLGDMSVETAKKNGKLKRVATVDKEIKTTIFVNEVCTIVTGD